MSPELTANRTLTADDVQNEAVALLEGLVDEVIVQPVPSDALASRHEMA